MNIIKEPVYLQIVQALKELLLNGTFDRGAKFLTEREIAEKYEVSRATANKALSALVSEGLVCFRKGIGTFVISDPLENDLSTLVSFSARAEASGLQPATVVRRFEMCETGAAANGLFGTYPPPDDSTLYYMERIRYASQMPVIVEYRHLLLPGKYRLDRGMLEGSLYTLLEKKFKITVLKIEQQINAVLLSKTEATALGVPVNSSALEINAIAFDGRMLPLWHERTVYRADMYAFSNVIDFSKGRQHGRIEKKKDHPGR